MRTLSFSIVGRRLSAASLGLTLALTLAPALAYAFDVPPNDGFVTDTMDILTADQDAELERTLTDYRTQTSNEIAILIIDTLNGEAIADVAVEIGRSWGVGSKEDKNGALILIAYTDHEVFIATGYGLEGVLPDIVIKGIVDEDIVPQFREGKYYEGVLAAVASMKKHIGGEYTADRYSEQEEGDGAWPFIFFVIFMLLQWVAAAMARTKSWWMGGVAGGIAGLVLTIFFGWWLSIPGLVLLGLLFDYILSKNGPPRGGRGGGLWVGGGRGGSGGGGFGGFGGGSFGGGGAGGKW